ncbi:hypothetical protein BKP37_14750 [Anaerobacillus alkalilacustris]|uniref:Mannosyl-glycoprotein endo-beta-N-acetylglucosamidase-like domain-containing protein n=1 Tax=Anaerobacillus alkalilacustris TaxID=393763 RepID=A0A1S2LH35_9BACI|nr:glucosaminidase domain-containing protein [Anaerobacillus alkalilacustris]OIJ11701.1 hypothetical protein BKP37_14750 [Anaerobacillus alkalilacustris]
MANKKHNIVALATAFSVFVQPLSIYAADGTSVDLKKEETEIVLLSNQEETEVAPKEEQEVMTTDNEEVEEKESLEDEEEKQDEASLVETIKEEIKEEDPLVDTSKEDTPEIEEATTVLEEEKQIEEVIVEAKSTETVEITADQWLEHALGQFHFFNRLALSIEGYYKFPQDTRFVDAINTSARSLLNWAVRRQNDGDFVTAIDSYERILAAPSVLNASMRQEAMNHHKSALHAHAMKQFHFHDRLALSIEGYNTYPNDTRFVQAINTNAQALLNWTISRHQAGEYAIAADRYNRILSSPVLAANIRNTGTYNNSYATQQKRTPEMYYDFAIKQFHFHDRIDRFVEGFQFYNAAEQTAGRFNEGLHASAQHLLNWSIRKQNDGDVDTAINRYEYLLSVSRLNASFRQTVETRHREALYHNALKHFHFTERLVQSIKGHQMYPTDDRFVQAISTSVHTLLNWTLPRHRAGDYEVAVDRYNLILTSPILAANVRELVIYNKGYAEQQKRTPEIYYEFAAGQFHFHDRLALFSQALDIYDEEEIITGKFHEGIYQSARHLINWSKNQQNQGNFSVAIDRYQRIINAKHVPQVIKNEAQYLLELAQNGENAPIRIEISRHVDYGMTLTQMADLQWDRFRAPQVWATARNGFVHRDFITTQTNSNGNTIYRVNLTNTSGTLNVRETASSSGNRIGFLWHNQAVNFLRTNGDWYEIRLGVWQNAEKNQVAQFANPANNSRFQHLVLTESVNLPASELNKLLQGRGTLDSTASTFIEAGRRNNANEIYLISHALLETGNGGSRLARGIFVDENGEAFTKTVNNTTVGITDANELTASQLNRATRVYNMFGIAAFDSCPDVCGARHAFEQGWTTPEKAILGGSAWIASRYLNSGKDTLYKMRWQPTGTGQYATDVNWAAHQANRMENFYNQLTNYTAYFDYPTFR